MLTVKVHAANIHDLGMSKLLANLSQACDTPCVVYVVFKQKLTTIYHTSWSV
jgi:hypothetical protein